MKIHFIGIGGIGVSSLAQYYLAKGHSISGSDTASSEVIKFLEEKGVNVSIGEHNAVNLPNEVDLVVYSPAVQPDNPELKRASELQMLGEKIKVASYPEALGELTKKHFTIAVSGTHGKSSVVAMLALILIKAGLNPTVILGAKMKEFGGGKLGNNFRMGGASARKNDNKKYLLIEACEHLASFLNYWPKAIVLTNIEKDHLDYYKNLKKD